jgi:acyl-CoA thioester hydrolase
VRSQGALFADVEVEVSFHDVDMVGVVWHGHYLRYLEDARWALMNQMGYGLERMIASGFAWPIVELHTKYISPARFGDRLRVRASLVEWESRLAVNYLVSRPEDGGRVARARTVQVAVDAQSGALQFATPRDFVASVHAAMSRMST